MAFKKGQSGNPKGRPTIIHPELQREVDRNKGKLKALILTYLNSSEGEIQARQQDASIPMVERILGQVMERSANDGDMLKFRMLLEIVFGKLPEEPKEFDVSPEERAIVLEYRRRIAAEITDQSEGEKK